MVLGVALGFIGGIVVRVMGKPELSGVVGAVPGYLASIPVSIYVLKKILEKQFKTFSVALVTEASS